MRHTAIRQRTLAEHDIRSKCDPPALISFWHASHRQGYLPHVTVALVRIHDFDAAFFEISNVPGREDAMVNPRDARDNPIWHRERPTNGVPGRDKLAVSISGSRLESQEAIPRSME